MTKKIRLFVLGTGGMAASHCKAFNADPRVEIVGCADIELARAEKFSKEHNAGRAFGSLEEAIKWEQKAYEDYGLRYALKYLYILRDRKRQSDLLKIQSTQ